MNSDELQEIQNLFQSHMSIRSIARRLGRDPKTIRRALGRPRRSGAATPARKLEPFHELIAQMASQDLTAPRILRELRTRGYSGGLTILKQSDLLRGSVFDSLEHLRQKTQEWLDTVANVRRHSTTARRVDEMYAEEKPLLIALPPTAFLTARAEQRKVQKDG